MPPSGRLSVDRNLLSCSFPSCGGFGMMYHQDCIERYLKSIRLERCVSRAQHSV